MISLAPENFSRDYIQKSWQIDELEFTHFLTDEQSPFKEVHIKIRHTVSKETHVVKDHLASGPSTTLFKRI